MNWRDELERIREEYPEVVSEEDIHILENRVEEMKKKMIV